MKNNNQQQNKKSKMIGRDAINRVSTKTSPTHQGGDQPKTSPPLEEGTEGWSDTNTAKDNTTSPPSKGGEVRRTEGVLSPQLKQDNNTADCHSCEGRNLNETIEKGLNKATSKSSPTFQGEDRGVVKDDIAVKVSNVSKTFKIPHAKIDSMRSMFVNMYKKRTYEKFNALDNISFEVKKGEFLGIIGHNGAGKSTLLKTLAGVYVPSSGEIEINGMISPFLELGIGFNPELSGRDNIYLNATVLGLTKKQIDEKFDEIVQFAELERFIDEQLKNYSSGMQARLAFSVSIHADREILIMDEVLAVGDNRFAEKCLDVFKGYKKKGKTVILVTHSMATVREYCDRALLLHKGELLGSGDVDEVCDEYVLKNMTEDQRKELEKKEKIEQDEKGRVKKIKKENIKIYDIEIFDNNMKEKKQFIPGDVVIFRIKFKLNKERYNEINFGTGVSDCNEAALFGIRTFENKMNGVEKALNQKYFQVRFVLPNLSGGSYIAQAAIWQNTDKELLSFFKKEQAFEVINDNFDNDGAVAVKYKYL